MGRTKALIDIDGQPMATRVTDALVGAGARDVVLIGGHPADLAPLGMSVVPDLFPGEGPLGGVLTALRHHHAASHVAIAACDLPGVTSGAVRSLVEQTAGADVVVAMTDRLEPALAVWSTRVAAGVELALGEGVRALHEMLGRLDVVTVEVDAATVFNANRPGDLPDGSPIDQ